MTNLIKKQRREKDTRSHTAKIMLFCIVLVMSISLISGATFDNTKSFDKNIGSYGKYEIKDWFGILKLQDLELKSNTNLCNNDCRAEIPINHYQDGILIEDIRFIDVETGKETEVKSYELKTDGRYYIIGSEKSSGNYDFEIFAELYPLQIVDWQIKVHGVWLDEWAIFGSSLQNNLIHYWDFNQVGNDATDRVGNINVTLRGTVASEAVGILNNSFDYPGGAGNYANTTDSDSFDFGTGGFSISGWVNTDNLVASERLIAGGFTDDGNNQAWFLGRFESQQKLNFGFIDGGIQEITVDVDWTLDKWHHWTIVRSGANLEIFWEGESVLNWTLPGGASEEINSGTSGLIFGARFQGAAQAPQELIDGFLDEIGIWDRALTRVEVATLNGTTTPPRYTNIFIDLNSPANNFKITPSLINFNATGTAIEGATISNASLFSNASGNFVRTNETSGLSQVTETVIWDLAFNNIGDFSWFVEFCDNLGKCQNTQNRTISISSLIENSKTFNSTALETSIQTFIMNVTIIEGFSMQNADLIYNGTIHTGATIANTGGNFFDISKTITLEQGVSGFTSENRTFLFNVTTVNETSGELSNFISSESTQLVNEISFGSCAGTLNISMLNFTMVNEISGIELNASDNATTFQATFNIGVNPDNLLKNFTINEQMVNKSRFNFCTSVSTNVFTIDMEAFYTAEGFAEKNYFLEGATLTNTSNLINLSMIADSVGVEFFIDVEQDLFPLTNAIINIQKFFVGEGVFRTVEIDKTDNDGKITAFLDLNKAYNFAITKDNKLLAIIEKTAICEAAPCTILLSITGDTVDVYAGFSEAFATNVLYNLTFNGGTKQVLFEFIDTTGLATSFRMDVIKSSSNSTGQIINTQTLFTSAGSMTFDASNESGNFKVETFISRSPAQFIDFITFFINEVGQELGILGLLMGFITILTIIFGISFTPRILVFAVPMALTTVKLMGLVSLSNTALTALYILAGVAVAFMSR